MKLYHATKATRNQGEMEVAERIVDEGFRGGDVWDLTNVVFLASKPLTGFGGWQDAWVVVDVPDNKLELGAYPEKYYDDEQYHCQCFAFKARTINKFPRYATTEKE